MWIKKEASEERQGKLYGESVQLLLLFSLVTVNNTRGVMFVMAAVVVSIFLLEISLILTYILMSLWEKSGSYAYAFFWNRRKKIK